MILKSYPASMAHQYQTKYKQVLAMPAKQVICMKWGDKYGPEYVNRLHGMLSRQLSSPFKLLCLTDNIEGIRPEVTCYPLPELGCEHPQNITGRWNKIALWQKQLYDITGPVLFMDLDSVIVDNIEDFFNYGDEQDVILARNWLKPHQKLGQTTLFRFYVGKHDYMLENFQQNPQATAEKYRYEQHYVTRNIKPGIKFWPEKWVKHYRLHCLSNNYIKRYLRPAKLPESAKIIAFPGQPQPEDALIGQWTYGEPNHPWQHIKNAFNPEKRRKNIITHLKSYQKPCPWVAEHWRE